MKILITGASGMIGQALVSKLLLKGYTDLVYLTRNRDSFKKRFGWPGQVVEWDWKKNRIAEDLPTDIDHVIHLAGESIAGGRWTKKKKDLILNSRVKGTELLVETLNKKCPKLKSFISSSAIGIYGPQPKHKILDEASKAANDFLADVCVKWEQASESINSSTRRVLIRTGVVLAKEGGALEKMLPPFQMGAGGPVGDGQQVMSWVHIDDLVDLYIYAVENEKLSGVYNGTAPEPLTNKVFSKVLGKVLGKPVLFPVPPFVLKLALGEMSQLVTQGQFVSPKRTLESGFEFQYPRLASALSDILKDIKEGYSFIESYQWIPKKKSEVFSFFSKAENLEKITPKYLNFKIIGKSTENIEEGTLIDYKLSLRGLPMKWKTLISEFEHESHFIDSQLKGPYKEWIHLHKFYDSAGGTLMRDYVKYRLPMGLLGKLMAGSFVKKDVNSIFQYRKEVIEKDIF